MEGAECLRWLSAEAVAMEAGLQLPGWMWWLYFVAMEVERWWPCCWWVVGAVPAVAMVAEVLKEEVVVGCWGEEEVGASYPWVVASYPSGVQVALDLGPLEAVAAASRVEAFRWGLVA